MKKLLAILSVLALGTTTGNFTNFLNTNTQKSDFLKNNNQQKTQQDTIYIDENGNQQTTSEHDLSNINSKEIIQIGFYENDKNEIQVVKMPETIEKVPSELPSEITSLSKMFYGASAFNQDLSSWNVSNVTDISSMFVASAFNGNISNWNTSKVTNMSKTFASTQSFNGDISNWNVSNVTDMSNMFLASAFNGNISKWNTSKVTNMNNMFHESLFNQDISKWNVSNVRDMSSMFIGNGRFNQNISKWNTSKVTNMSFMFYSASSFNQDLSKWNVSNVIKHKNFADGSGIDSSNKLPKFKKFNNDILFEKDYRFLAHDWLKTKISYDIIEKLRQIYNTNIYEFKNYLLLAINDFPKLNNSGSGGSITQEDIYTMVNVIITHWNEISNFQETLETDHGILVVTNTISSWDPNDSMGVFKQ